MLNAFPRAVAPNPQVSSAALLLARVATGLLFIDHALTKYTAKGGLAGFKGFLQFLDVPAAGLVSQVVPVVELLGGILLVAGLLTRPVAVVLAGEMAFTATYVKLHAAAVGVIAAAGAPAPGAELDIMYFVTLVLLAVMGAGRLSVDWLAVVRRADRERVSVTS